MVSSDFYYTSSTLLIVSTNILEVDIMKKLMLFILAFLVLAIPINAFEIESPLNNETYNDTNISLIVNSNESWLNISYELNDEEFLICENCQNTSANITAQVGDNTLKIIGINENETKTVNISFKVEENETEIIPTLQLISPTNKTYDESVIELEVVSNTTLDRIDYILNSELFTGCEDCYNLTKEFNLSEGEYNLTVRGYLNNTTITKTVSFNILFDVEEIEQPEKKPVSFDEGLQHLPREVERGELTDKQLADIIRDNQLNPGIVNRLIKTQMLGEESLDAILETQFNPPGIFARLFSLFGVRQNTYASLIHDNYNLTERTQTKLLTRDDLPARKAEKVKEQLRDRVERDKSEQRGPPSIPPGQAKKEDDEKSLPVGRQNGFVPPGQARRG